MSEKFSKLKIALKDLPISLATNFYQDTNKITLADWLKTWLDTYKANLKSRDNYNDILRRNVSAAEIGKVLLKDIKSFHIQNLINNLFSNNQKRLAQYVFTLLKAALNRAHIEGLIDKNPLDGLSKPQTDERVYKTWSKEEVDLFMDKCRSHHLFPFYYLAILTGLRKEELLGLRWENVDLDNGIIYLRNVITQVKGGTKSYDTTKNGKKNDIVQLGEIAVELLLNHKEKQIETLNRSGWSNIDGYVFTNRLGHYYSPSWISQCFKKMLKKAGVPVIRVHDLRHSHATLLFENGLTLEEIARRLRHSSTTVTRIYAHTTSKVLKRGAELTDKIFSEKEKTLAKARAN